MMYQSPIEVFMTDIHHQVNRQQDEQVYQAVVNCGVHVDKEELLRALRYDRQQYEAGVIAGRSEAMAELVRCKGCAFVCYNSSNGTYKCMSMNGMYGTVDPDGFCSYGERRDGE